MAPVDAGDGGASELELVGDSADAICALRAMLASFGVEGVVETKLEKRVFVRVRDQVDIAALAAIAAAGPALRDELFPAKGNAAMPAVSGANRDSSFVYEHEE